MLPAVSCVAALAPGLARAMRDNASPLFIGCKRASRVGSNLLPKLFPRFETFSRSSQWGCDVDTALVSIFHQPFPEGIEIYLAIVQPQPYPNPERN